MSYTNSDGLFVLTDGDQGAVKDNGGALAATKVLVIEIPDATKLGTAQTAPTANDAFIPAGSYITSASFVVTTAFTSGGSGTLGLGLFTLANAAIDADGIDAAIAKAEILIPNWRVYTDYFLLLKYEGSWKIVHKSYTRYSNFICESLIMKTFDPAVLLNNQNSSVDLKLF